MPATKARGRWRDAIGWLLLALPPLLMLYVLYRRTAFIDGRIGKALECYGCFRNDVLLNDWPLAAAVLVLLLLGFACRQRWLALLPRLAALLVMLLYVTDYLTSTELSSRLVLHELPNYLADTGIIGQHLGNTGFITGPMWAAGLAAAGLSLLLLGWPALTRLRSRSGAALMLLVLASGVAAQSWPKTRYVHSWMMQNVVQYNMQRGEMQPYSAAMIERTLANPPAPAACHPGLQQRHDLIVLILESWSVYQSRYFGGIHNWTPRLDSLAGQGLAFDNFHAAGFSTNEGLMSLLTSMEILATGQRRTPYITAWGGNYSLPAVMRNNGYHSSFLTSGHLGFSRKDLWLEHLGFDHIEGHNHPAYDGLPRFHFAAVADEHLYRRSLQHMTELEQPASRKPYALVIESVSSHHPYKHPHTGSTAQADVFGYMDSAAADFIEQLRQRGFFSHGRLLVVSDHRAMVPVQPAEQQALGLATLSRIPAFWLGRDIPRGRVSEPFHQADVLPTLEHWIASEQCNPHGLRDMLSPAASTPRCVYHVRGDRREAVNLFCPDGQGEIRLAGDRTRFERAQGISAPQQKQALHWLNHYRMQRDNRHGRWLQRSAGATSGR